MALTFVQSKAPASKSKAKNVTEVSQVITPLQASVDEYVGLASMLESMGVAAIQKRMDVLKKELHEMASEAPLDDIVRLKGTKGIVMFSAAKVDTVVVDKDAMMSTLGEDVFRSVAKVGITDLRKYLTDAEMSGFCEKQYGSRSLKGFTGIEE
jgi:hypothetical protein